MSTNAMHKQPMPDVDWNIMNSCQEAMDCLVPMGVTSENVSKKYGLTRNTLDEFAAKSHAKADSARARGLFRDEIIAVGDVVHDDGIRSRTTAESLGKLKPVFDEKGSTTAGNASQLTDGAAAVLLMTRDQAEQRGLPILGVWRSFVVKGVPPSIMGIGPAIAIPPACEMAGFEHVTGNQLNNMEKIDLQTLLSEISVSDLQEDLKKIDHVFLLGEDSAREITIEDLVNYVDGATIEFVEYEGN